MAFKVARPHSDEYPEFFKGYIAAVEHEVDGLEALERQQPAIAAMAKLQPEQAAFRYADGKWTVKQVVGHIADAERIFAYRLLRIARGDQTPLPSFDENKFVENSNADRREISDLASELADVRRSTIALARSLDEDALENRGTVRGSEMTARAQVFVTAGHLAHHLKILRERYKIELD